MWKKRLKRIVIVFIIGELTFWGVGAFAKWREKRKVAGGSIKIPTEEVVGKIGDLGEEVLGKAVEVLPGGEKIKKTEKVVENKTTKIEIQPEEATKVLESQTKEIVEILKQLPEDQLKQIKKQIFKDFCQEIMEE